MIYTNRSIMVGEEKSTINSSIILYRGDRRVEVEFTLTGHKFMFAENGNVIKSTNATHGQLVINTPLGDGIFSDVSKCVDGKVIFVITKEMIDELDEVGFYDFQIRLYDGEELTSRITIPPILKGIDIREPLSSEERQGVTGDGEVNFAEVRKESPEPEEFITFLPDNSYNKTEWVHKDIITDGKLNKIEDAIYKINERELEATSDMEEYQKEQDERLTNLEDEATNLDNRTTILEERTTSVENRTTDLESKSTGFDDRIVDFESELDNLKDITTNIEVEFIEKELLLQDLEGRTVNLESKTTNIENRTIELELDSIEKEVLIQEIESKATATEEKANNLEIRTTDIENRVTPLEDRATNVENRVTDVENRTTNLETDSARKEVLIQALLNEETDKVVTVEANGNEKHLDYAIDDWMVKLNKIEGQTLVNVCDQKDPIAITKSYTVEKTNHVPLQGEYDGKARPIVYGNTLVNRAEGVQELTVLPKMELQGNNEHNIDGIDGAKVEVSNIKGKTMVNLVQKKGAGKGALFVSSGSLVTFTRTLQGNYCVYESTLTEGNNSGYITINTGSHSLLKPDTKYTFMFTIKENTANIRGIAIRTTSDPFYANNGLYYHSTYALTTGVHMITITTDSDISSYTGLGFGFYPIGDIAGYFRFTIGEVMLFEGDLTQTPELIPTEYVEGLKSSFEDEYIPENKLVDFPTDIYLNGTSYQAGNGDGCSVYYHTVSFKTDTVYTVFCNINEDTTCTDGLGLRLVTEAGDKQYDIITGNLTAMKGIFCSTFTFTNTLRETNNLEIWNKNNGVVSISNMTILEGDYTHLTEEDFNHLGQYKVDVKTVGKNKLNVNLIEQGGINFVVGRDYSSAKMLSSDGYFSLRCRVSKLISVKKNTDYTISIPSQYAVGVQLYNDSIAVSDSGWKSGNAQTHYTFNTGDCDGLALCWHINNQPITPQELVALNIQLEEGTQATEYEPYKEDTHVVYLNTPLLEGDELVYKDGKLCHHHKMGKVVLDGSEDWVLDYNLDSYMIFYARNISNSKPGASSISDRFVYGNNINVNASEEFHCITPFQAKISCICISKSKLTTPDINGFKQWLSENPTTVVYELEEPWYEPIGAYEKVVLDGSEDWTLSSTTYNSTIVCYYTPSKLAVNLPDWTYASYIYSDKLPSMINSPASIGVEQDCTYGAYDGNICIMVNKSRLSTLDADGFKQWLQANPTTVVYELANPNIIKEPIAIDVFNNSTLTINSNVPVESTVKNYSYRLTAFSEPYTLNYNADGEVTHEIVDDRLTLYGEGVKVSDVILVDGENTPTGDYFEGLSSSFEDGYIPENLATTTLGEFSNTTFKIAEFSEEYPNSTEFTILCDFNSTSEVHCACYDSSGNRTSSFNIISNRVPICIKSNYTDNNIKTIRLRESTGENVVLNNAIILEGDWTHLTEEDFNHLGQYKVEYKVTGKNKFDNSIPLTQASGGMTWEFIDGGYRVTSNANLTARKATHSYHKVEKGKTYSVSANINLISGELGTTGVRVTRMNKDGSEGTTIRYATLASPKINFTCDGTYDEIFIQLYATSHAGSSEVTIVEYTNIQLEEGSAATEYEPYKESTKTFYLNSPLLKGDTIEDINGVATHVKRYNKVVLDGSEDEDWGQTTSLTNTIRFNYRPQLLGNNIRQKVICNNINPVVFSAQEDIEGICNWETGLISCKILKSRLSTQDITGFKQWLQQNPTTVVYELASPIYEPISTESILCDSYVNGHLDFDGAVPIEKVDFVAVPYFINNYLSPSTNYTIQFESDEVGVLEHINIGGKLVNINLLVNKGINKFTTTTLTSPAHRSMQFTGIGFNVSNIQVVATDRDVDFGYFKGLQSSFESNCIIGVDELELGAFDSNTGVNITNAKCVRTKNYIEIPPGTYTIYSDLNYHFVVAYYDKDKTFIRQDSLGNDTNNNNTFTIPLNCRYVRLRTYSSPSENDLNVKIYLSTSIYSIYNEEYYINLGKYKVEYKVTGKNKFDSSNFLPSTSGIKNDYGLDISDNTSKYDQNYISVKPNTSYYIKLKGLQRIYFYDINKNWIRRTQMLTPPDISYVSESTFTTPNNCHYIQLQYYVSNLDLADAQLEEGTEATSYEPYKESTKTFYLNSPLLEGDTIEEVNGKMCHVHRMGKVVLDGSEDEGWHSEEILNGHCRFYTSSIPQSLYNNNGLLYSDRFKQGTYNDYASNITSECIRYGTYNLAIAINSSKLSTTDVNGFKQWLSENPTTVVYELAEPWYEPIEPEQGQLLISSVKEGDLSTETAVPIKNMSISYTTCVPSAVRIESELLQTQTIQNEQDALLVDLAVQQAMMNLMM